MNPDWVKYFLKLTKDYKKGLKRMELEQITAEELIFSGNIEDDRTNTYLQLNDYDWMSYKLSTRFKTEKQGVLNIEFEYFGTNRSLMKVSQILNNDKKQFEISYDTDIFIKYLKKFLKSHMKQWDDKYAFNGEDIVLKFYNEVIEKGKDVTGTKYL